MSKLSGIPLFVAAAIAVFSAAGLRAQEADSGAASAPATEVPPEAGKNVVLQDAIGKLIPEGKASVNVTVPGFADGILKTLVKAASITRLDDETLEMISMLIEMYGTDGKPILAIDMEAAQFDMPSGILESRKPAMISNEQFDIVGEQLVYDTVSEQGKLLGKVTMYVYTSDDESEEGSKKSE